MLNIWSLFRIKMTKKAFSFRGASPPDPHQGLCPWTPLGAPPPYPRYRLALRALAMVRPPFANPGSAPVLYDVLNVKFLSRHSCLAAARQSRSHSFTVRARFGVLLLCCQSLRFLETNISQGSVATPLSFC